MGISRLATNSMRVDSKVSMEFLLDQMSRQKNTIFTSLKRSISAYIPNTAETVFDYLWESEKLLQLF